MEKATELEFLKWFYSYADFGPANSGLKEIICEYFTYKTGKALPEGYEENNAPSRNLN